MNEASVLSAWYFRLCCFFFDEIREFFEAVLQSIELILYIVMVTLTVGLREVPMLLACVIISTRKKDN